MTDTEARFELDGIETRYTRRPHGDKPGMCEFYCPCGWVRPHRFGDRLTEASLRFHYDHCELARGEAA